jgi:hypothetical protein
VSAIEGAPAAARREPRARYTGLSQGRLAWLQATQRRATAACLGLCMAMTVLLPALLPLLDGYALERAVAGTAARDGGFTVEQEVTEVDQFSAFQRDVEARVTGRLPHALLPLAAYASTAPLHPTTLNSQPAPGPLAGLSFQGAYLDGLADHVEMQAGELPPDGLGGGETAVTISQTAADITGLNLNDRICLSIGGDAQDSGWCARIVGLWRPIDGRDPFWGGRAPLLQFAMGRYDLFQLARRQPPDSTTAGARYWVDPAVLDASRAIPIAQAVRGLATELRAPGRQVLTSLDSSLLRVIDQHRVISTGLRLFTVALSLLGLVVVGLAGHGFLAEQSRLLSVLRARGWPRPRIWFQAFAGLAAPALYGLPVALGACLLVLALAAPAGSPAGQAALGSPAGRSALYTGCALAALLVAVLAGTAASAVWRDLRPSLDGPFRPGWLQRRAGLPAGALALVGLAGLLGVRLAAQRGGTLGDPAGLALAAVPVLGVVCLAFAAALLPRPAWLERSHTVPALLAGWQLRRAPAQYAAASAAVALAATAGSLALLTGAREWAAPEPVDAALRAGSEATLGLGCLGALGLLVIGVALHERSLTRRRLDEYAGLLAHGLSAAQLRGSLAREQLAVSVRALVLGSVIGTALALVALSPWSLGVGLLLTVLLAILAVVAAALLLLAALMAAGGLGRRVVQP